MSGLEKCMNPIFLKGRLEKSTLIKLDHSTEIKEFEQEEVYKYLGNGIHVNMKNKIKECYRRVWAILKTESKQLIHWSYM